MTASLQPAGPVAGQIATLWWLMLALGTAAFVVFGVLLAVALLRRRDNVDSGAAAIDPGEGQRAPSRAWIVGGGVIQPLVLIIIVFALTLVAMRAIPDTAPTDALVVEITGHMWWYEVRYPEQGIISANEMHIPVDRAIDLRLISADVIHSFWLPELGGKTDMLPDGPTSMVLQADEPGEYFGVCAEFCGLQHTRMGFRAVAHDAEDFADWVSDQQQPAAVPSEGIAAQGQEVFGQNCAQCHTIGGTPADGTDGPDLTHFASRATIAAGTVDNTSEDLAAWITDPHAIKDGVNMPPADLEAEELEALMAYLEGLR